LTDRRERYKKGEREESDHRLSVQKRQQPPAMPKRRKRKEPGKEKKNALRRRKRPPGKVGFVNGRSGRGGRIRREKGLQRRRNEKKIGKKGKQQGADNR